MYIYRERDRERMEKAKRRKRISRAPATPISATAAKTIADIFF